jgi:type IV pilus assembly protein PilC
MEGEKLSDGLRVHHSLFNPLYLSLVAAGERAGVLDESLATLVASLEASRELKKQTIGAAIYPTLVVATLVAVVSFLLTWVVPTFEELFTETGAKLPWLTEWVLLLSRLLLAYGVYGAIAVFVLATFCWHHLRQSALIKLRLHSIAFTIPILRTIIQVRSAAQTARTLSALLRAGIPPIEALTITADVVTSPLTNAQLQIIREQVANGISLTASFSECQAFPQMLVQMIAIGEESGRMELMLDKAASFFEEELRTALRALMQAAEPTLILLVGVVVGTLVVAMYLPIFQLGSLASLR